MERLALVELAPDPLAQLALLQVAQDEQGLDQPPVLLEGPGQAVLAGEGLQLGQQQRRQDRTLVDRRAEAQQVVPRGHDALGVDPVGDQRLDERRQRRGLEVP